MELLKKTISPVQLETIVSQTGARVIYGSAKAVSSFEFHFDSVKGDTATVTAYSLKDGETESRLTINGVETIWLICQPEAARDAYAYIHNNERVTALSLRAPEAILWVDVLDG